MSDMEPIGPMDAPPKKRSRKQIRFLAGGAIVAIVVGYLIFSGLKGATAPYLTVAQVKAEGIAEQQRLVRVTGTVVGASIQFDAQTPLLTFDVEGEGQTLSVAYSGARPDMLQDGAEISVEGKLGPDGVFKASQLFLKCPSKYETSATEQAQKP
jgi:cytochrome c-type biogenesis protein CcmE